MTLNFLQIWIAICFSTHLFIICLIKKNIQEKSAISMKIMIIQVTVYQLIFYKIWIVHYFHKACTIIITPILESILCSVLRRLLPHTLTHLSLVWAQCLCWWSQARQGLVCRLCAGSGWQTRGTAGWRSHTDQSRSGRPSAGCPPSPVSLECHSLLAGHPEKSSTAQEQFTI